MFKKILIELLAEHGLTQADLANQADIPKTTVSGWLTANRKPDYIALQKLSIFFNVSADYLIGLEDEYGNAQKPPVKTEGYFKLKTQSKSKIELLFNQLNREQQSRVLGIVEGIFIQDGKDVNSILGRNVEPV